ncbi:MAG: sulfotransferase, partial [Bacteroidia bacterium]|nr:sulfotransferase [Bacteroidia bacterium]
MEKHKRTEAFAKDIHEEKHLSAFNHLIAGIDKSIIDDLDGIASPILFILGSQRSGSTLLSQMLINHFELGYPNNFIARFWKAPLIGTILYDQIFTSKPRLDYTSTLGYTDGPHGPHEFGYFWKSYLGEENNTSIDKSQLASILGGLTKQTQSPWLFKNLHYIKNNIKEISRVYP